MDGDAFDLNLSELQQRITADERAGTALDPDTLEPLFGDLVDRTWQPQPFSKELTLTSLSLDWDLGWADLVSATGWSQTDTMTQLDSTIQFGEVRQSAARPCRIQAAPSCVTLRPGQSLPRSSGLTRRAAVRSSGWWACSIPRKMRCRPRSPGLDQLDGSPLPAPLTDVLHAHDHSGCPAPTRSLPFSPMDRGVSESASRSMPAAPGAQRTMVSARM